MPVRNLQPRFRVLLLFIVMAGILCITAAGHIPPFSNCSPVAKRVVYLRPDMDIFLIRHTTPAVTYGTCYGFADLDLAPTFPVEASRVQEVLPDKALMVFASPLQRCSKLAGFLFGETFQTDERLREVNFGDWEMKTWEDIAVTTPKTWMADYLHEPVPNGESYAQLYSRSIAAFREIIASGQDTAIVTHGGVIRSILAFATGTPIEASYDIRVEYGRVAHLHLNGNGLEVKGVNI